MNNSGQMILYLLLLLVSLATGYWFYNNFSWVEEETEVGFQGIAKTNKLLAAEFFLREMGLHTRQVNGLLAFRNLPSPQHTLLIATQRETLNKELSQKLLNWVELGGHLIVEAKFLAAKSRQKDKPNKNKKQQIREDHLLEDVSVWATKSHADKDNNEISVQVSLEDVGQNKEIEVNFPYNRVLSRTAENSPQHTDEALPQPIWLVKDDVGQYLMQFSLGQGLLTVLASTSMFTNEHLAEYDHAQFLHYLVQYRQHNAAVWLIRADDMPALWTWLWENAKYVMFSLVIVFLLWLWRAPLRFGPQLNDVPTERRSLLEHIQASGSYRWHENQSGFLLARVQETLWEIIQTAHPAVRRENLLQAYTLLAEITGIKQSLIQQALTPAKSINEHEFTKKVRILEVIRKHL